MYSLVHWAFFSDAKRRNKRKGKKGGGVMLFAENILILPIFSLHALRIFIYFSNFLVYIILGVASFCYQIANLCTSKLLVLEALFHFEKSFKCCL